MKEMEREEGGDDVKQVLGRFLSRRDQYGCNQSCNSKSHMQPHKTWPTALSRQEPLTGVGHLLLY